MTDASLAADFPNVDRNTWRHLVDKVLKGAPYDRKLIARTLDGLALDALAPRSRDRAAVSSRPGGTPWTVTARVDLPDPAAANVQALDDLEGGASGLALVFDGAASARGFGLRADGLDRALEGIRLDLIETRIEAAPFDPHAATAVMELALRRGLDGGNVHLDAGADPIGDAALRGGFQDSSETISESLAALVRRYLTQGFKGAALRADTRIHHEAGAGAAQELAAGLATAVDYLRALDSRGIGIEDAARRIEFTIAVDADQFETMGKLRAARLLWGALLRELGLTPSPLRIHAETSWRMATRHDPHVNLLRASIAAFAAGAGGADSIAVMPFTQALGLPDGFARRMARNTQAILIEEANAHRVADPGAGAGAVEQFTDALAGKAWDLFRDIERHGGLPETLASGWWQDHVAVVRAQRMKDIASRKAPLTGTSEYPALDEKKVRVLRGRPGQVAEPVAETAFPPLAPHRLSEPYEALRDAAEAHAAHAGTRPAVFLATLGSLAAFTPRASFARNLFAAGGLDSLGGAPYADTEALLAAFSASGARLACLCGTDEAYDEAAAATARALTGAGATVWLAGHLTDPEEMALAGISHTIFAGCDAVAALRVAQAITLGEMP